MFSFEGDDAHFATLIGPVTQQLRSTSFVHTVFINDHTWMTILLGTQHAFRNGRGELTPLPAGELHLQFHLVRVELQVVHFVYNLLNSGDAGDMSYFRILSPYLRPGSADFLTLFQTAPHGSGAAMYTPTKFVCTRKVWASSIPQVRL